MEEVDRYHSLRRFFSSVGSDLEQAYTGQDDDATVDFDNFSEDEAQAPTNQIAIQTHERQRPTDSVMKRVKDPSLEELEHVVAEFEKKSNMGSKLANIMLRGLEKTLPSVCYSMFCQGKLPGNWIPIVKMNDDNTPYVEFLIKSDIADQDPASQLNDYTMKHIYYSKLIVNSLAASTRQIMSKTPKTSKTLVKTTLKTTAKSAPNKLLTKTSAARVTPKTSTPSIGQRNIKEKNTDTRQPLQQQQQHHHDSKLHQANESTRSLPYRACKSNLSYRCT